MKKFIISFLFLLLGLNVFAVEVSDYSELQNAVNSNEDTIALSQDIEFGDTPLVITSNTILTSVEGSSFTVKGNGTSSPMFTFYSSSSSISNINFSSSTAADPAVYINVTAAEPEQEYSTFTISNVTFLNNTSSTSTGGGALNIVSEQGVYIYNTEFSTNYATGLSSNGGALYYQGEIGFTGENITAYYNSAQQNGGAIYASTATIIGSTFTGNSTSIGNGGAIYISSGTIQKSIFSSNTAVQDGGAIYASTATIQKVVFKDNMAGWGNGGAVYITDSATIENSDFLHNTSRNEGGGAIYNEGTIKIINTTFDSNKAFNGGGLYNKGTAVISEGKFTNNNSDSDGGAIYNEGTLEINGTEFDGNKSSGSGGAIYVKTGSSLTLNDDVKFTNNAAEGSGGAIYVDNDAALNLNLNGKTVTFRGNTDISGSNDIFLNGSSTFTINGGGTVNFHGGVLGGNIVSDNVNINWYTTKAYNGDLSLTGGALNIMAQHADAFNTVSLNSAALSIQNGTIDDFSPSSLNITGDIPLYIDVDLSAGTVDTVNNVSGSGSFNITRAEQLRILSDTFSTNDFTVTNSAPLNINVNEDYYGPLYVYNLQQIPGGFTAIRTDRLNPTISALPVAANSKVVANVNTVNSLYNRIDVMLSREYLDYSNRSSLQDNMYVRMLEEEIATVSGESLRDEWQKMVWFIPNAGYQKVDFGNDVGEVKNIFYGGLAGVDYPFWLSDTSAFIPTVFAGYLGARQKYQETTLDNNSLAVGGMLTYMKDFAILSAQAYITNGSEEYKFRAYNGDFDVFSFTASVKGELNLNLTDHIVMQPAFTVIYNLSNLQNYTTANLAQMKSTRFHNFLLTPAVKFMASCAGWYPYVGLSYNFSDKQKGTVAANDLSVTKYKLKNFGEVSVGLENNFFKNYSGYAQISGYTGSSKGISFQMGLRGYLN